MITGNEPISPVYDNGNLIPTENDSVSKLWMDKYKPLTGLTIRQHFAAMANGDTGEYAPSTLSKIFNIPVPDTTDIVAFFKFWVDIEAAYKVMKADALISELNKTDNP